MNNLGMDRRRGGDLLAAMNDRLNALIEAEVGDFVAGLESADRVFERTFRVHQVQQCPIEPHIAIAAWDSDERLVITSSTQVPFHVRRMVAPLLDLPVKRIRIIKPRIGGGFGAKQEMLIEDIVGHLTIATGRPVRLELTREEEFVSSRTRHPQTITFRTGVDGDGKLTAQEMRIVANTGAHDSDGYNIPSYALVSGGGPYRWRAADARDAIERGAVRRFRPVMMTLVSTMLGALPLILSTGAGAEARESIGWVVFGGLALSAVFTLYLTPALYSLLAPLAKARAAETQRLSDELDHAGSIDSATTHHS